MTIKDACIKFHTLAIKELGVHETPGPVATARIIEYDSHTTLKATTDEIAWCSSYINFIVDTAGFEGTHSAAAISWKTWGVYLKAPTLGCVVIISRYSDTNPTAAHVTFCHDPRPSNGLLTCIGGNQGDAVSIAKYPISRILGYRGPKC